MVIKFIADVNVEKKVVDCIIRMGHDIKWIPDYNCKIDDRELLQIANAEQRILVTNDKDFGELVFLQKQYAAGIILMRVNPPDTMEKVKLIEKLLLKYEEKILNHFIVVTKTKLKFIQLEGIR